MYLLKRKKKKVTISYSKPLPQSLKLPFPVTFLPGAICCLEILATNMHFLLLNLVSNSNVYVFKIQEKHRTSSV